MIVGGPHALDGAVIEDPAPVGVLADRTPLSPGDFAVVSRLSMRSWGSRRSKNGTHDPRSNRAWSRRSRSAPRVTKVGMPARRKQESGNLLERRRKIASFTA